MKTQAQAELRLLEEPEDVSKAHDGRVAVTWDPAACNVLLAVLTGAAAAVQASEAKVVTGAIVAVIVLAINRRLLALTAHTRFLPMLRWAMPFVAGASVFGSLALAALLDATPSFAWPLAASAAGLSVWIVALPMMRARPVRQQRSLRLAVIGSSVVAHDLRDELASSRTSGVRVLGYVGGSDEHGDAHDPWRVGELGSLAAAIERHRIDLFLLSDQVPRMQVFNELADTCADSGVRVQELHAYYEQTFGHVPLGHINSAWFQWVMHPRYNVGMSVSKRVVDLAIASVVSVVALPLLAILAAIVRLDGGPAVYRQVRVGERGKAFEILKLRSMAVTRPGCAAVWTASDDERVTRIGRFLRRTHLDELPQLLNVFRGEMSIVGPRPEQPGYVHQLEAALPHYSRRNMARPGITGWAQVKCGYAGSEEGSTWKLSHDLYYLKHGSLGLDLLILGETVRTLLADRQYDPEHRLPVFVRQRESERLDAMHDGASPPVSVARVSS